MAEPIVNTLGIVGMKHCGAYDSSTNYEKLNVVTYQGSSYCAKGNTVGNLPTNTTYWDLLAKKGDNGDQGATGPQGPKPVKGVDYYTAEDKAELELSLSSDVTSEVTDQLGDLTSATPLAASSIAGMTDTTKIYVNTTDGHWYWYNGTSWRDGGVYQATGLADDSIYPNNIYKNNVTDLVVGSYSASGVLDPTKTNWRSILQIPANAGDFVQITKAMYQWIVAFDSNHDFIEAHSSATTGYDAYVLPTNTAYIGISIYVGNVDTCKIYINGVEYLINKKYKIDWLDYNNNSILPEKLIQDKITDFTSGYYDNYGKISSSASWMHSPLIPVEADDEFAMTQAYQQYLTIYNSSFELIEIKTASSMQEKSYTLPANSAYIGINVYKDYYDTCEIHINDVEYPIYKTYDFPWLKTNQPIENSHWKNKNGAMFGDSIVEAYHDTPQYRGYPYRLKESLDFNEFTNYGQSGRPIANGTSAGNGTNYKIRNTVLTSFDLIVIAGGTNDFKLNVPLGTLGVIGDSNFDTNTFYGALRDSIEYILTQNNNVRICLWTPLQRDNAGYDVNYINSAGCKLIDYVNAIREVGEMYSIPVCDMYANSGVTKLTLSAYTVDGLHPNKAGYDFTSNYYINFIKNI